MGRKADELSALAVRNLKEPGLHFVGGVAGLALQVLPTGGRSWILRVQVGNRRRDMGLGGFPDVPLADAKDAAREARRKIREGIDPIEHAREAKSALKAGVAKVATFREAAKDHLRRHLPSLKNVKHQNQWRNTLEAYAYPVIGDLDVRHVEIAHVLQILEPIWQTKNVTASDVRNRIELVLNSAAKRGGWDKPNPARWRGNLDAVLPRPSRVRKVKHHTALPIDELGAFMLRLRQAEGVGARALEFAILTVARSGEVRGATWSEIDLQQKTWTIPGARMKAGKPHRIPLSARAVELLEALPRVADSDLVFPSSRGRPLSENTLNAVLKRMKVDAVTHGFRSTFSDWTAERTGYPDEVREMALAHTIGNKTEAAYRRGDLFDKRVRLMRDWAVFCEKPSGSSKVVGIRDGAAGGQ
jgi:integrase